MTARLLLPVLLVLPVPVLAAPITVAIIKGDYEDGTHAELEAQLDDSTRFDLDAELVVAATFDGSSSLDRFDVVVVASTGRGDFSTYPEALRAALDDFANNGGGVVTAAWTSYEAAPVALAWMPIDQERKDTAYCGGPSTVAPTVSHPVVDGVGTFTDSSTYWETPGPARSDAEVIATTCGSQPAVTVREATDGVGRLVYLGGTYGGIADSYRNEGLRTGAPDRLLEQAVVWAGGGCQDVDEDGFTTCSGDCDDDDAARFPGNPEVCDELDNDCNDQIDEGLPTTDWWPDVDEDGAGDASVESIASCRELDGHVDNDDDCDDTDPDRFIGNLEVCDELDNDCNDEVDDGLPLTDWWPDLDEDGYGDASGTASTTCDDVRVGYATNDEDCNDDDPSISPVAEDIPDNGIDEDCDGEDAAGEGGDDEVPGGCGCTSSGTSAPLGLTLLLPLVVAGVRRRRRG